MSGFKALVWLVAITPLLVFLLFYSRLQPSMVMQWGLDGQANWQAPRLVFGAFLLIEIGAAWLVLTKDKRHGKPMVLAIFALISLCAVGATVANLR